MQLEQSVETQRTTLIMNLFLASSVYSCKMMFEHHSLHNNLRNDP